MAGLLKVVLNKTFLIVIEVSLQSLIFCNREFIKYTEESLIWSKSVRKDTSLVLPDSDKQDTV